MTSIFAHSSQFFWFSLALLLWSAETFSALFLKRPVFWRNLREFPGFLDYLWQRWLYRAECKR